ncbi:hypothetical protein WA026_022137 [Henosepilachna vigintioctopunctata]|uniref:Tantalus-like domain-containing protein n=1 Tax=Henosepilachna vigintioctopunctata TaxID=420089 RepID=A0AAW1TXL1_9CUCU
MEIDNQLDSLHLSEPSHSKRRKLSGLLKPKREPASLSGDSTLSEIPEVELSILREENGTLKKNEENTSVRRSGRRKSVPVRWDGNDDLSKRISPVIDSLASIEKYYLDRTVKKSTASLETIFEETQENKGSLQKVMSLRKLRRSINFSEKVPPGKIRKRQLKASKLNPRKRLSINASLEDLHKKLKSID